MKRTFDEEKAKIGMSSEISELDPDLTCCIRRPTPPDCCILLRHLKRVSKNQIKTFEKILKHFNCL